MEWMILILLIAFLGWVYGKINANKIDRKNIAEKKTNRNINYIEVVESSNLSERICGYLKKDNIRHWLSEDRKLIRIGFDVDKEGCFDIFINIHDNHLSFVCEVMADIQDEVVAKSIEISSRINQYYNFGQLNFFFESRVIAFKIVYPLFQNELNESKFEMYFSGALDGARVCRPIVKRVVEEGEEPIIAAMSF